MTTTPDTMTMPDEIASIFALAFTRIPGQPSDDALNDILLVIKPLLHNIEYDMAGPQNLVGLIDYPTAYATVRGQPWVNPALT